MPTYAQIRMIIWTFAAVILTGAVVVFSLLSPPSSVVTAKLEAKMKALGAKTNVVEQTSLVETADRSPASVQPQFSSLSIDESGQQALDFTLPCEGRSKFAANVLQVRLSGTICSKEKKKKELREIASSEIRNEANGFSATVFFPHAAAFTTDYITLAPGENRIRILHIFKQGGREERDYVIERALGSKKL